MSEKIQQHSYRWIIVIASALILAISMGAIVNGMSAFIVPMQEANGWQRGDVSLINFSGIIGLAFGGMALGRLADRVGVQLAVGGSAGLLAVIILYCLFLTSRIRSLD